MHFCPDLMFSWAYDVNLSEFLRKSGDWVSVDICCQIWMTKKSYYIRELLFDLVFIRGHPEFFLRLVPYWLFFLILNTACGCLMLGSRDSWLCCCFTSSSSEASLPKPATVEPQLNAEHGRLSIRCGCSSLVLRFVSRYEV